MASDNFNNEQINPSGLNYPSPNTVGKEHCGSCKYILIFSFLTLLVVMVLVYVQGTRNEKEETMKSSPLVTPIHSVAPTKEQEAENFNEYNQRVQELGQTLRLGNDEASSLSATSNPDSSSSTRIPPPDVYPDGPVVLPN